MNVEFRTEDAVIKVYTATTHPTHVTLSIERHGEGAIVYLPQSVGRALASALMGAAAEVKDARNK